jgi:hypothetical protein
MSVLRWSVLPAKRSPKKTWAVVIFLSVFLAVVYFFYGLFAVCLGLVLLALSLLPFFLRTRYEFSEDGFVVKKPYSRLKKEWSSFRSYYPDKNGVLLSPFAKPSRLENFRGVYIMFGDERDAVLEFVGRKVEQARQSESA